MALIKWGEVQNERGFKGAVIGAIVGAVIGFIVLKDPKVAVAGALIGCIIGHFFDPVKTVIYREEDVAEKK